MSLGLNVRFGSEADVCSAKRHVRFAPNSDRKSGLPRKVTLRDLRHAECVGPCGHVLLHSGS